MVITLAGKVTEDRRLIVLDALPDDVPVGDVHIQITPQTAPERELTREEVRARLIAAGALVDPVNMIDDALLNLEDIELSDEALAELGEVLPGISASDMIIEMRGEY